MILLMVLVEYTTRVVTMCGCIIACGVDVIIFNAIERNVACVLVVRVGPRSMTVDGCMLVPVCIVYLCFGYVCRNVCMMVCVYMLVCLCACI